MLQFVPEMTEKLLRTENSRDQSIHCGFFPVFFQGFGLTCKSQNSLQFPPLTSAHLRRHQLTVDLWDSGDLASRRAAETSDLTVCELEVISSRFSISPQCWCDPNPPDWQRLWGWCQHLPWNHRVWYHWKTEDSSDGAGRWLRFFNGCHLIQEERSSLPCRSLTVESDDWTFKENNYSALYSILKCTR